jgi:hypothetical protein
VMSLAHLPKAKAWRASDGRMRFVHSFDDADDATRIFSKVDQVELDPRTGTLTFKPSKNGPGSAWYRYTAQPPFVVCYDRPLAQSKSSIVMDCFSLSRNGSLIVGLAKAEGSEGHTKIDVLWRDMKNGQFKKPTQLLTQKDIDPKVGCHATFRLPLPNARITNHFTITFAGFSSEGEDARLAHLLVQGRLGTGFGIVYANQGSLVFAKKVIPGRAAAKAGVHEGDIIASINKENPQSAEDAARLMRSVTIGNEVRLTLRRGEQEREIKFIAE